MDYENAPAEPIPELKNAIVNSNVTANNIRIGDTTILAPKELVFQRSIIPINTETVNRSFFTLEADENSSKNLKRELYDIVEVLKKYKRIVLLGEAGTGKSTELKRISRLYIENDFSVAHVKLKDVEVAGIVNSFVIPNNQDTSLDTSILLIDGLDEVNSESASRAINTVSSEFPELLIIATSRTNIYSNQLSDFQPVFLENFSDEQIEKYLNLQLSPDRVQHFRQIIPSAEISELLAIPFYLDQAVKYYTSNGFYLPKSKPVLLDYFVQASLTIRLNDASSFEKKDQLRQQCLNNISKVAFIAECMGRNSLPIDAFRQLFDAPKQINLVVSQSSMIHSDDGKISFVHRILQEYLVAALLRNIDSLTELREIICVYPEKTKIKSSWINTISYLWSLLDENKQSLKKDMKEWLFKSNPEIILRFESSSINRNDKETLLKKILDQHVKERNPFDYGLFDPKQLGEYCQSVATSNYLVDRLANSSDSLERNCILEILNGFSYHTYDTQTAKKLRFLLLELIYSLESSGYYTKYLATNVFISRLDPPILEEVTKVVECMFSSDSPYERLSSYRFITKGGFQKYFMHHLLQRKRDYDEEKFNDEINLAEESYYFELCFSEIASEETLVAFFEEYPNIFSVKENTYRENLFGKALLMVPKLVVSTEGHERIFIAVKHLLFEHVFYNMTNLRKICVEYINGFDHAIKFIEYCLQEKLEYSQLPIAAVFTTDEINIIISFFQEDIINDDWINRFIGYIQGKDEDLAVLFISRINSDCNTSFELKEYVEHETIEVRKERELQENVQILFSEERFLETITSIYQAIGTDNLDSNKISHFLNDRTREEKNVFYSAYNGFFLHFINRYNKRPFNELVNYISQNWQYFSLNELRNLIRSNGEYEFSADQVQTIRNWTNSHYPKVNLSNKKTNGDILFYFYSLLLNFTDYPDNIYLNGIQFGIQNYLINSNKFDLILFAIEVKSLDLALIEKAIGEGINNDTLKGYALYQALGYAKKYQFNNLLQFLPSLIEDQEFGYRRMALEAYVKFNEDMEYLFDLLIKGEADKEFEDILIDKVVDAFPNKVEKFLMSKFRISEDPLAKLRYAKFLLYLDNTDALQYHLDYIKKYNKSPFTFEWDRKHIIFGNVKGIAILVKIFVAGCNKEVDQDKFNTIPSKVRTTIFHLAQVENGKHYPVIVKKIKKHYKFLRLIDKLPVTLKTMLGVSENASKELGYFIKNLSIEQNRLQNLSLQESLKLYKQFLA